MKDRCFMQATRRFAALVAAGSLVLAGCTGGAATTTPSRAPAPTDRSPSPLDGAEAVPPAHPVTVSGLTPFPDCTAGEFNERSRVYSGSEVEPSIAVDPSDPAVLVGAFQQDRWSDGGARGIVAIASGDAGRTWSSAALPITACAKSGTTPVRASDPWVSFGPDGIAYLIGLAVGDGIRIATSRDGGRSWPNIQRIPVGAGRSFADKPALTADPSRDGVAYAVWNEDRREESRPRDTVLSTTSDGGATWSRPRVILEGDAKGGGAVGDQILVDRSRGTLLHVYNWQPFRDGRLGPAHVGVQISRDGGATWSASRLVQRIQMVEGGPRTPSGSRIRSGSGVIDGAVDPRTGAVYLVWEDARFGDGKTPEIALSASTDGGMTWTAPRRISPTTVAAAFTPMAEVSPDGRLAVTFYAIRAGSSAAQTDLWIARSSDGGRSFQLQTVDGPFDLVRAPNAGGLFLGDYTGLASSTDGFAVLYAVTSSGPTGSTDVRAAFVP